jgi:hypothetical protein
VVPFQYHEERQTLKKQKLTCAVAPNMGMKVFPSFRHLQASN